jgi:hypothetical protein
MALPVSESMSEVRPQPGDTFYDSAVYEFPEGARAITQYADGPNTWAAVRGASPTARQTYPFVHSITVEGGTGLVAVRSLILDFEERLRTFGDPWLTRDWAEARIMHEDRAVLYCARANLRHLLATVGPLIWNHERTLFWIPTLDGMSWTPQLLASEVETHWGVSIPASRIWANQNRDAEQTGGPWDSSRLLGQW